MLVQVEPLPAEDLEHILRHTAPLWDAARDRRMFISGGTGFFGVWLLESLAFCNRSLKLGMSATVLTRNSEAFLRRVPHLASENSIRFLPGDVRDFPFPEGGFDYVLHAATPTSGEEARHAGLPAMMMTGMERMLGLATASKARRFLFTSSGAVYGPQPENMSHIPESYAGSPGGLTGYGSAKRRCEEMCIQCGRESNIEFAIGRCFAFVGPHLPLDQHFAIGNFIGDALAARTIQIAGDGTPMRSYLYAADLAIWLWTLLLRPFPSLQNLQIYNVGSGDEVSIRTLAQEVIEELNPSLAIEVAQEFQAGTRRQQYVPDVTRAEKELGLRPRIDLRQAIRRTADWYRRNGP